jgi:hypothetical protein
MPHLDASCHPNGGIESAYVDGNNKKMSFGNLAFGKLVFDSESLRRVL